MTPLPKLADEFLIHAELLDVLKENMFMWKLSHQYRSNWRVLHIDGLEGLPALRPLPRMSNAPGGQIQIFQYEPEIKVAEEVIKEITSKPFCCFKFEEKEKPKYKLGGLIQ